MDQFQRNVLFVAAIICAIGGGGFLVNHSIQEQERRLSEQKEEQIHKLAEQKVEWRKANLKALRDLSVIGALSTEEQIRTDNAGDDFDRLQRVLIDIHTERFTYWMAQLRDVAERRERLETLKTTAYSNASYDFDTQYSEAAAKIFKEQATIEGNVTGYRAAALRIQAWTPITFEDYCNKKSSNSKTESSATQVNETTEKGRAQYADQSTDTQASLPNEIWALLTEWQSGTIGRDPEQVANCYMPSVDIYFTQTDVKRDRI